MKESIVGYVTGMVNTYGQGTMDFVITDSVIENLNDLLDYIVDLKEEPTDTTEENARYINRITELEDKNGGLEIAYREEKADNDELVETCNQLSLRSVTLSVNKELQEVKNELAEAEETIENYADNEKRLNARVEKAELEAKGYNNVMYKLMRENNEYKQMTDNSNNKSKQLQIKNEQLRATIKQLKTDRYNVGLNK